VFPLSRQKFSNLYEAKRALALFLTIMEERCDSMHKRIILFDGECNFCNSSVQFILKRDKKEVFSFASRQSEIGKQLCKAHQISDSVDSLIFIDHNRTYIESTAALRICLHLTGAWKCFYALIVIPPFIRNKVYQFIARNRYRLFGKADTCFIPPRHVRKRFL